MYLNDKGLVLAAGCESHHAHVRCLVDEVLNSVEDSATGGRDPPVDSPLADGLAGHTRMGVDVLWRHTNTHIYITTDYLGSS